MSIGSDHHNVALIAVALDEAPARGDHRGALTASALLLDQAASSDPRR